MLSTFVPVEVAGNVKNDTRTIASASSAAGGKKGVSWGTVKTHRVHALETASNEDMEMVSPSTVRHLLVVITGTSRR